MDIKDYILIIVFVYSPVFNLVIYLMMRYTDDENPGREISIMFFVPVLSFISMFIIKSLFVAVVGRKSIRSIIRTYYKKKYENKKVEKSVTNNEYIDPFGEEDWDEDVTWKDKLNNNKFYNKLI